MDTSREYILQCEKAEEIQKNWKPKSGDWYLRKYTIFDEELDKQVRKNKSL